MKRREFVTLLGGAAVAWPLAARAQQGKIPRVGIIDNSLQWEPFRQGLRDRGYVDGRTIVLEYRDAAGAPDRLADAAAELAQLPVDVIATYGTPPTRAAKQATERIPIVMIGIGDPVGAGLVASLALPGGNITGNTVLSPDLGAKRLQLLKEGFSVSRVAFLLNLDNVAALSTTSKDQLPPVLQAFGAVAPLVTDIDLSMDDRFLYVACWGTGEMRQYDVTDPRKPKLVGSVHIGGIARRTPHPNGKAYGGGPQMVEISRDGKRVYWTNSLYSTWDNQFYPMGIPGAEVMANANASGGLELAKDYFVSS
jgi:hypothetical protein